jgi:hypothetical protein
MEHRGKLKSDRRAARIVLRIILLALLLAPTAAASSSDGADVGIYVAGASTVIHECDVCVLITCAKGPPLDDLSGALLDEQFTTREFEMVNNLLFGPADHRRRHG